ncbi:hypothetical protein EJ08DRAFT_207091 [Tothia fuscella]|uniref:Uncharacterized protein n=1 Tax=Tothia fuscella TaxID=1048955 RepID=A0A9P4NST9_9PEZI|nr:hypothetical protein EJ08DRAFT_207091 [Tothia fuscella]
MATTTAGAYNWGPSSPPTRHSSIPDQTSPVYSDRPIKPLPRRRLRDRLSAEHAEALASSTPQAPNTSPIFGYPYAHSDRPEHRPLRAGSSSDNPSCDCGHDHPSEEGVSEEDDEEERQRTMQFAPESLQITRRDGDYYGNGKAALRTDWDSKPAPPGSTASSGDGYESFENTNNKKKRKIPQSVTSSNGGHGHGHSNSSNLSADMANMGISQQQQQRDGEFGDGSEEGDNASSPHTAYNSYAHQSQTSSPSGGSNSPNSARTRPGRSGRGSLDRRPLGASTNGLNAARGHGKSSVSPKTAPQYSGEAGIISTAIANAAQQQQRSTTPPNGAGSVSLLHQASASKSPPQKTDFTFTPDGGENRPVWPGQQPGMPPGPMYSNQPPPPGANPNRRGGVPQGTQTSPNTNGAGQMPHPNQQGQQPPTQAGAPPPKQKKPRRPGRVYLLAARQRRLQQEYQNYHHPPRREDLWICEFCEYETIFGGPPTALIRQYEIKDRKIRKELAERRRLLEKAKMKGRKGKKGSNKNKGHAGQTNSGISANMAQQLADRQAEQMMKYGGVGGGQDGMQGDDGPGEDEEGEYYEDEEYDYDDDEMPPLEEAELPPLGPQHHHHHHGQRHNHSQGHGHTHHNHGGGGGGQLPNTTAGAAVGGEYEGGDGLGVR